MGILSIATTLSNSTAIALGGFDGMHLGHQKLFSHLGNNGAIVVIDNNKASLTPHEFRKNHTIYPILFLKLDQIKHLEAKEFLELLKNYFPQLKKIVVGYDFYFGKDRKYSAKDLQKMFEYEVVIVDEVKIGGVSVHSRVIRSLIQKGDIKKANKLLGYNYTIKGDIIKGQGIGAKELVATINLQIEKFQIPKEGVYATLTRIDDEEHFHPSVSFIGHRITTDGTFAIETHILDGKVEAKKYAEISFVAYLRENQKFASLEELKNAIQKDITMAKEKLQVLAL
ncbi:MAG: bifunctional riboflavin kinase/FAD synthetase [Epsilonproteobacteria bacterium]|nr:bifunctional riboflavin kinase/FAD synthetase [Campylobacterota bacterium]